MGEAALPSASMRNFFCILSKYISQESHSKGVNFKPSSSDVILSTPPKSGTTWLQQVCHGLRSGGNMDFDEIGMVVPCLEHAHEYGYTDLQIPQPYSPRMYKTHLWQPSCPKGASKYIVLQRQPSDAALSFYHFMVNWSFSAEDISAEEFIEWVFLMPGKPKSDMENASHFQHLLSWYPHRCDENVLWLHYEDMQQNLGKCVRLIAEFLEIGIEDEELQKLVTDQASFDFMKQHSSKFDEHHLKLLRNEAIGLAQDAGMHGNAGKVRKGRVNESKEVLSEYILNKIDQTWKTTVTPIIGYASYDAMREGINKELGRCFD